MIDWTKGKNGKKMIIELKPIVREDIETIWRMQVEAFSELLEKYQDMDIVYYEKD